MLTNPHRMIPIHSRDVIPAGFIPTNILGETADGRVARVWINTREVTRHDDWVAYLNKPCDSQDPIARIISEVARKHRIQESWIMDTSYRTRPVSRARWETCHRLRYEFVKPNGQELYSLAKIAGILNIKDHTSVLYAIRAHAALVNGGGSQAAA